MPLGKMQFEVTIIIWMSTFMIYAFNKLSANPQLGGMVASPYTQSLSDSLTVFLTCSDMRETP